LTKLKALIIGMTMSETGKFSMPRIRWRAPCRAESRKKIAEFWKLLELRAPPSRFLELPSPKSNDPEDSFPPILSSPDHQYRNDTHCSRRLRFSPTHSHHPQWYVGFSYARVVLQDGRDWTGWIELSLSSVLRPWLSAPAFTCPMRLS